LAPARSLDQSLDGRTLGGIGRRPAQLLVHLPPHAPRGHGASVAGEALDPREREYAVVEDPGFEVVGIEAFQAVVEPVLDGTRRGDLRDQEGD
jgi:hypothetical protein